MQYTENPRRRRKIIHDELVMYGVDPHSDIITLSDLKLMWCLYDRYFFADEGDLTGLLQDWSAKVNLRVENNDYQKSYVFREQYKGEQDLVYVFVFPETLDAIYDKIDGIDCSDRLYCFQLLLEHDMSHMFVDFLYMGDENLLVEDEHGKIFKEVARRVFGHKNNFFQHILF